MRTWMAAAMFALAACDGADPDDTGDTEDTDTDTDTDTGTDTDTDTAVDTDVAELVGAEDGRYVVGFQRGGDHFALGEFTIDKNIVTGSVLSSDGLDLALNLTVLGDGGLRIDSLTSNGTQEIELVTGRVGSGILEGTYTVDGESGTFAGRRTSGFFAAPTTDFDGQYEVANLRDGEEVAVSVAHVRGGVVQSTVIDRNGVVTEVRGFVTSDGTFVLTDAVQSDGEAVLAEATIDQDTFDVFGVYRSGDVVGRIVGRRAD